MMELDKKSENQQLADRIQGLRKTLLFAGKGGGTQKIGGACPRCGKTGTYRYFEGRWKRCSACGYDRLEESIFDAARWSAKRGQAVDSAKLKRALRYWDRVYGKGKPHDAGKE